ncbi:excalibur calcium-binding domain-containing protein [Pseudarthrobacter sp. BIM B-2242]|uniref:excalibur calcium-binding domain-containing protein n=1 Tax=Pseudarthrobacter sp. BIM B-2242 TaxID=2772401 RepID=UPI00168BEEB5|nr:excalibur calcium-binding domain-containing protein [Pseudarthrobacter sp. BIM B-2242]QOD04297.1 excalibur calcium-binding domain-containing protein [Pseudarthrobacter sp. BIM B-2242]
MKKTLALVVLTGLMLTGCGGTKEAQQPTAAAAVVADAVAVPSVVGLALDKATDQLKDLGFEVKAEDIVDGKTIMSKKNWQVMTQDPADGSQAAKGSTVNLGVKSLEKLEAEKAAADKVAAEAAAAEKAAADKIAAEKAAADKAAADQAAAQLAAEQAAAQKAAEAAAQAAKPAPVAPAPAPAPAPAVQAPAAAYYANCAAAKAAGAAPLYRGQPGYRAGMDGDSDGVACEK